VALPPRRGAQAAVTGASQRAHPRAYLQHSGPALFAKTRVIKDLGNLAVHSTRRLMDRDALRATTELFHLCFWLARTYSKQNRPPDDLAFNARRSAQGVPSTLPHDSPVGQNGNDVVGLDIRCRSGF